LVFTSFPLGYFSRQDNRQFKKESGDSRDAHRPVKGRDLQAIFSIEEKRRVNNDWTIRYHNGIYQLKGSSSYLPVKSYVTVQERLDGILHIYYRGREESYTLIEKAPRLKKSKSQKVTNSFWMKKSSQSANQRIRA